MKRIKLALIIAILTIPLSVHKAHAKSLTPTECGIFPIEATNLKKGYVQALNSLVRMDLQQRSINPIDIGKDTNIGDEKLNCLLSIQAVGLGDDVNAQLILHNQQDIERPRTASLSFNKEESKQSISRLLTAVLEDKTVEETVTGENMTEMESRADKHFQSTGYGTVAIGGHIPLGGFHSGDYMLAVEGGYGHSWRRLSFEAKTGLSFNPNGEALSYSLARLGVKYHFLDGNISPFVGGLLGINLEANKKDKLHYKNRWGMSIGASAGVTLLRLVKVNMPIEVRYQHTFLKGLDTNDVMLMVGLNF